MKKITVLLILSVFSLCRLSAKENGKEASFLFRENKGQIYDQNNKLRADILFSGSSGGLSYFFRKDGISYQLYKPGEQGQTLVSRIDMTWVEADPGVKVISKGKSITTENFYNIPNSNGITGVESFSELLYRNIYQDIDLHYYHKDGSLKYDFIVAPHADYKKIRVRVEGATSVIKNEDGSVSVVTPNGTFTEGTPVAFQGNKEIKTDWVLEEGVLSFQLGDYDASQPVIIDPLVYQWGYNNVSQTAGSVGWDFFAKLYASVFDPYGNIYVTSYYRDAATVTGSYNRLYKYDNSGNVIWSVYLTNNTIWNSSYLDLRGIAYYNDNNIYLSGATNATNIATSGAYQVSLAGQADAALAKFDSSGTMLWLTYYGGSSPDYGRGCKTDASGNVYLCGYTQSTNNMASAGAYQTTIGGEADAFIAKFDANGQRKWGSYFGGASYDDAQNIEVKGNRVFVAGKTQSTSGISTAGAHQATLNGGNLNGYLLCMDTAGVRQWSTYYGGDSTTAESCVADSNYVYLCGTTKATSNIATTGAYQSTNGGGFDGYLAKFNNNGTRQWGTYYGGAGNDSSYSNVISAGGNIYLSGYTESAAGIATPGAYNTNYVVNTASNTCVYYGRPMGVAYLAELDTAGQRISGTYCNSGTHGYHCTASSTGDIVMSGARSTYCMDYSGFIAKFSYCNMPPATVSASPASICANTTSLLSTPAVAGATYQWYRNDTLVAGAVNNTYTTSVPGSYRVILNGCPSSQSQAVTLATVPAPATQTTKTNVPCYGASIGSITVTATSGTPPYTYAWDNLPDTTSTVIGLSVGTYVVHTSDVNSCMKTDTVIITQNATTPPSDPLAPICAVTVDSATGKNLIVWEKNGIVNAFAYNLYRETSIAGQYELIGTQSVSNFSTFLDLTSLPLQQSYIYKIAEVDSCNHEWPLSDYHKTIHLSANVGTNGEINLSWNQYEGRPYSTHNVMRSFNGGPFTLLNQVSSSITSYSDLTPPSGNCIYRIEIDLPTACVPSKPTDMQHIQSNALSFGTTGINDLSRVGQSWIAPNPTMGLVHIYGNIPGQIRIYDAAGRLMLNEQNKNDINLGHLAQGVYLIRLYDKEGVLYYSQRIVLN